MVDVEKQAQWKKRIAAYETSGQSGASWCKEQGVSECQFWYWKKKFQKKAAFPEETTWVPVVLEEKSASPLMIRIGQAEVEVKAGYDEKLLQQVVRTLVSLC
jgi:hypothetical protein